MLGGVATAIAVCTCVVLLVFNPYPDRSRPCSATPDGERASTDRPRGARSVWTLRWHVILRRSRPRSQHPLNWKPYPSYLDPPLADAAAEKNAMLLSGRLSEFFTLDQPECATGDTASKTRVALFCDSNATMWAPSGLEQAAKQRRWRLEILGKGGCPPMDLPISSPSPPTGVHRVRAVAQPHPHPAEGRAAAAGRAKHEASLRQQLWISLWFDVIRLTVAR